MTSSCPQPPDMDDCKSRNKRCLSGSCVGFVYSEGKECPEGSVFNPSTCQCEEVCTWIGDATISVTTNGFNYQLCLTNGGCGQEQTRAESTSLPLTYENIVLPLSSQVVVVPDGPGSLPHCFSQGYEEHIVYQGDGTLLDTLRTVSIANSLCGNSLRITTGSLNITQTTADESCPEGEFYDYNDCECKPEYASGVYALAISLLEGVPTGAPVKYNYFWISDPYFDSSGEMVYEAPGIYNTLEGYACWLEDTCDATPKVSTVYQTHCGGDIPYYLGDPQINSWFSPWLIPSNFGRALCPWVCEQNSNYSAIAGFPRAMIAKYYSYGYVNAVGSINYPSASSMRCDGTTSNGVMYGSSGISYIGPGTLDDWFSPNLIPDGRKSYSSDTPLTPDLPGP